MKLICLEEHTVDGGIARASQPAQTSAAGYMSDWGSRVEDQPAAFTDNRPHLASPREAVAAAREVGASRIVAMDQHGIDMQVLSYSSSPQLAPASQAVELTRTANDNRVLGADRILYSIDYPYLTLTGARDFLDNLPIGQPDKEKIAHGNAEALLGL